MHLFQLCSRFPPPQPSPFPLLKSHFSHLFTPLSSSALSSTSTPTLTSTPTSYIYSHFPPRLLHAIFTLPAQFCPHFPDLLPLFTSTPSSYLYSHFLLLLALPTPTPNFSIIHPAPSFTPASHLYLPCPALLPLPTSAPTPLHPITFYTPISRFYSPFLSLHCIPSILSLPSSTGSSHLYSYFLPLLSPPTSA
jgi:hypothetical protein